jgi:NAD(P)H dehydrogenase (quinone)
MIDMPRMAVTGATGAVGGLVARHLADGGYEQRLLVRDAGRAPHLPGAAMLQCSYGDRAVSEKALEGVDVLFMVSASESADRLQHHLTLVDAASAAGVRQIVYTSFVGAAPDAVFTLVRDHSATEQHIQASGMDYTFLRDNLYLDFMEPFAGEDRVLRGPAGDGRTGMVARADVARVATAVLRSPDDHAGVTYTLTGPEALTLTEVAATLTAARGLPFRFHNETIPEAYASRQKYGAPAWQVEAWVSTYTAIAAGQLDVVTDDVERVSGRKPVSLAEHLAANPARG